MVKQIRHLRTHRKGSKRGLKFRAGSKPIISTVPVRSNVLAVLQRPVAFKKLLKHFLPEAWLQFRPGGMRMVGMDPANVAAVDLLLKTGPNGVFTMISKSEDLAVNVFNLVALLKNAKKDEVWIFTKEENKLLLENPSPHIKFSMPLIELDVKDKESVKKETFDKILKDSKFTVNVNSHDFSRAVSDADAVAESIVFTAQKDGVGYVAKGDFTGSDGFLPGVTNGGTAKAKYSIEYLKKLKPVLDQFEDITLRFADNFPMVVSAGNDLASLMFVLAPRVDSEESAQEAPKIESNEVK